MASSRSSAPFLLAFLVAAALLSSCYASPAAAGEQQTKLTTARKVVIEPMADPKCEVMSPCSEHQCTQYCLSIGLGMKVGFCSFHGLQVYCCCPVPDPPAVTA